MSDYFDIRSIIPDEADYDTVFAWIRFPNQVLFYAQREPQKLRRISCRDCLSGSLQLLSIATGLYGEDHRAMLIQQARGEKAREEVF